MSEALPDPLVPASVVLRDFEYMPLDVVRLRDSHIMSAASAEAFRCAVRLWCVSWHQVPAASLPDDDVLLSDYAGFGRAVREWKKHRAGALHGWVKCSDGRLYHPVVAEKAIEAQHERHKHAYKTECARIKKHAQRMREDACYPAFDEWLHHFLSTGSRKWEPPPADAPVPRDSASTPPGIPADKASKGREGKGREVKASTTTTSNCAHLENPNAAAAVVGALNAGGYSVNSEQPAVRKLVEMGATAGEIDEAVRAAKGLFRTKPMEWVVSRIAGKRADAQELGAGVGAPGKAAPDPVAAAQQAARNALEDKRIECRHMVAISAWTQERAAEELAKAQAAHDAAVASLGVPA